MILDISMMNGYPSKNTRGIPAICLLNTKVNEWIEDNVFRPSIIRMSGNFRSMLESEYGEELTEIDTLVGRLSIINKDLELGEIEIY